ncbi:LysR family transcriptional regulator [Acuticoccus sp. M5D2P5]|uniref:LysR family transcriptional regulator n=1 Tax=Acuticoccus kalidii TaxID=2910977 RepID=UPI001F359A30|nr:LysR family transcriptional regulator [Acuticoccus kalidii]MCF3933001.1 LysR family transcriptional regulator [Acuticoccus kalidii]
MPLQPGQPTFDQLKVFLTVVDVGSFAGAARVLGRATSVVSYTVANLENQLGLPLFDRNATRKPVLTEAGRAVAVEARTITTHVDGLRAKAAALLQGLEGELNLAIDVMVPSARVVDALKAFAATFPTVTLNLRIEALGSIAHLVLDGQANIGISGPLPTSAALRRLERITVGAVELVAVAAPGHPLTAPDISAGAVREHVQLILTDRSHLTEGFEYAVMSPHVWRLADLGAKHMLLREGIGWGNMPEPMVRDDLAAGRLVRLDLPASTSARCQFDAIYRTDTPPGPAAAWLIERFRAQMTGICSEEDQD